MLDLNAVFAGPISPSGSVIPRCVFCCPGEGWRVETVGCLCTRGRPSLSAVLPENLTLLHGGHNVMNDRRR